MGFCRKIQEKLLKEHSLVWLKNKGRVYRSETEKRSPGFITEGLACETRPYELPLMGVTGPSRSLSR